MAFFSDELFERVLVDPIRDGADEVRIVSGYATPMMAIRHLDYARAKGLPHFKLELIVGMGSQAGMAIEHHKKFQELQAGSFGTGFFCRYIVDRPPVHTKAYIWLKSGLPVKAFVGSANYTQNAFSTSMREILVDHAPDACLSYFQGLIGETRPCSDTAIEEEGLLEFFKISRAPKRMDQYHIPSSRSSLLASSDLDGTVKLSLLDSHTGETPVRSGLNWGQRESRDRNQAYLAVPALVGASGFFPERGIQFMVLTDDGKQLICARAQDGGKAIQTTENNAQLGEYFRYRLGLSNGQYVQKSDLLRYGRADVVFTKIDDETYFMDFSVPA